MRKDLHRPPHLYIDNAMYFITASTINKIGYFNTERKRGILIDVIVNVCIKFSVDLIAWIVLDNHYHILTEIKQGLRIPGFINNINANSSRLLNRLDNVQGRKVWYQYFDRCLRSETDYWTRFNYIHNNCVKHGYSVRMDDYKYSSYRKWLGEKGAAWMNDVIEKYPVVDFTPEGEI